MFPWQAARIAQLKAISEEVKQADRLPAVPRVIVLPPVNESNEIEFKGDIKAPGGKDYLKYQYEGIRYALAHKGTLLADEMGLGKTIQAIGVINSKDIIRKVLIVCPNSLKRNWVNELDAWLVASRRLSVGIFPAYADIVIINYDLLHKLPKSNFDNDLLILDEAHYIKNEKAKRTTQVKVLAKHAKQIILLTGTPILNRPKEIWSLLQVADVENWDPATRYGKKSFGPGEGGNFFKFGTRYCGGFKMHAGKGKCTSGFSRKKCPGCFWDFSGATNLDELQERLKNSCMIRRLKSDVLTELPPKRRQIIELDIDSYETGLPPDYDGIDDYDNLVRALRADKVLFDQISSERHRQGLAKANDVISHVESCLEEGIEKIILFAHHKDVIQVLANGLRHHGLVTFTGEDSEEVRNTSVDVFQDDPNCRIFLGSIGAAGVGITLHSSSHVVFAELDWTPGVVNQAEDRAHRIGQKNSVLVQHLVLNGSIDARMCKMLVKKQEIITKAIG